MPRPSTRDQILEAGRDFIHRQGYSASGIAEITQAAGVPKGSFYNHFASKEAFAGAALDSYWAQSEAAFALLEGEGSADERVRAHFKMIDRAISAESYAAGCMLCNFAVEVGPLSEDLRKHVGLLLARWTARLATCLEEGQKEGSVSKALPAETLARFLVGAWHGAVQRAKVERNGRGPAAFHRSLAVLLTP
jgi:TetR/AcrR family transcriptional repressor of nem operon